MAEILKPNILVIQARVNPNSIAAEQARIDPLAKQADVDLTYINPLTGSRRDWRSQQFLTQGHSGVMLLGSSEMDPVQDTPLQRKFMSLAFPVVGRLMEGDEPVLGICYGDQTMARVLSEGSVGKDPSAAETGTGSLELTQLGEEHIIFQEQPTYPIPLNYGHKNSVVTLPRGAQLLGKTVRDPHSAWVIHDNKIGIQGHPELTNGDELKMAIEASHDSPLGPYVPTYPVKDTLHSSLIVVEFMIAAANGELVRQPNAA